MPSAILGPVAGAVVGGLMGGDDEQTQTQSRDPWGPAQPWMRQNLQTGQNLQGYYEQNPFNQMQRTSYQNMAGDIDNFRNNINPGLMEFANRLMGTNYSRSGGQSGGQGGRSSGGSRSQSGGQSGQGSASGLEALFGAQDQSRGAPNATMGDINEFLKMAGTLQPGQIMGNGQGMPMAQSGPFSAGPSQSYGLIDWREMNPFTATNGIQAAPPEKVESEADREARLRREAEARQLQEDQYRGAGA
jgi:hypothetical protein